MTIVNKFGNDRKKFLKQETWIPAQAHTGKTERKAYAGNYGLGPVPKVLQSLSDCSAIAQLQLSRILKRPLAGTFSVPTI